MKNYFNYFTEIEEQFQRRRGSLLLLSTIDWALIETWREAGVPLEAVLRGIDSAFDKYDARKATTRVRRINGLAWCSQEVMAAVEAMKEASIGAQPAAHRRGGAGAGAGSHCRSSAECSRQMSAASLPGVAAETAKALAARLEELANEVGVEPLESLERNLTVMEEKLFAALMTAAPEAELLTLREQAARELAPYRSRMQAVQIKQVEQQFLHKRLLEKYGLPRLSLFYMSQA